MSSTEQLLTVEAGDLCVTLGISLIMVYRT